MPEETLLYALEQLRSSYNQRKRTTGSLMVALKAVNGGLNKVSRALEAYTDTESTLDPAVLHQTRETFNTLHLKGDTIDPLLPELRRESKTFATLEGALKDAQTALSGKTVDVVRLDNAFSTLSNAPIEDQAITDLLPQLEHELQQAQQQLGNVFGAALRDAMAEQGVQLGGRPPRFEAGLFEIHANFVNRTATILYGKDVTTRRVSLSVDAVLKAYQRNVKEVTARQEDGARWIAQLYAAWELVRRKRDTTSTRANIIDCYNELVILRQSRSFRSEPGKRTFRDYSRAQFSYDFSTFTIWQPVTHEGKAAVAHEATKSHTENAARSIWIIQGNTPHEGRYIGDIEFK